MQALRPTPLSFTVREDGALLTRDILIVALGLQLTHCLPAAAQPYSLRRSREVVQLVDAARHTTVSVATSVGNLAVEMTVNGTRYRGRAQSAARPTSGLRHDVGLLEPEPEQLLDHVRELPPFTMESRADVAVQLAGNVDREGW